MYSSQIDRALRSDPYVSPHFIGVFPSDQLPNRIRSFPCSLVANTDPSSKKGEHWVCFYFDPKGSAEYFDSYGFPPMNMELFNFLVKNGCGIKSQNRNPIKCNNIQLQNFNSNACGHYCIAYLASRARGISMREVINSFKGRVIGE